MKGARVRDAKEFIWMDRMLEIRLPPGGADSFCSAKTVACDVEQRNLQLMIQWMERSGPWTYTMPAGRARRPI